MTKLYPENWPKTRGDNKKCPNGVIFDNFKLPFIQLYSTSYV